MVGESISHYRIVAQIGAGGMGIVYRAFDEHLQREVAIKVLPPGSLADEDARRLFRKEALALARLNHPNIATIFEFGSQNGRDFLVTEFIPGVNLSEKLVRGPLDMTEIVGLGIQLAMGLTAAHEQGLIHRDLKPGNVRVTPDGRLKILDFGLARLAPHASDLGLTATVTHTHQIVGTLPYMSPEQLRGDPADSRSDIWAAGAVLYEMATAKRPFAGDSNAILIDGILNRVPPPANRANSKVARGLDHVISKALQKNPAQRYQSAADLRSDLERIAAGSAIPALPKFHRRFRLPALLVLAAVLAAAGIFFFTRNRIAARGRPRRRAVAVLGFKNLAGKQDQAWLSTALSEMLTTELAAGDKLRTIPGENVARAKSDIQLPDAETLAPATLSKLNRILGADVVVLGSYLDLVGQLRVDVRVEDTSRGGTLAEFSETGTEAQLFDLVRQLGEVVREKCGAGAITAQQASSSRAAQPRTPEAARLYSQALDEMRSFDVVPARDLLSQAIAAEPSFALAHESLAEVWSQLGYDERAKQESKQAYDLSAGLAHPEALAIEARYREDSREWKQAAEIYRSLWTVFPDNPEYGLRLARALTSAGKGQEALSIVGQLRQLAAPMRDDPRIDLAEAEAARSLSDYRRDAAAAETAIRKAGQRGSAGLRAEGLLQECWALRNLGEPERAKSVGQQAGDILAHIGDLRGQARSLTCVGDVLADQGQLSPAQKMHDQALALARKIGAQKDIAGALINLGNDLASQQNLSQSTREYDAALRLALSIGDRSDALLAQDNLGENLEMQGDFHAALQSFGDSVQTAEAIGDQAGVVEALTNRSWVLHLLGDLGGAKRDLQQAIDKSRQLQLKSRLATALVGLGDVQVAEDDAREAQSSYQQSLQLRQQLGEKGGMANSQLSLAGVALENGQAAQAASLASGAIQEFEAENDADQRAAAENVLARALIAQSRYGDASRAMTAAQAPQIHDLPATLSLQITAANLLAKTGQPAEATRRLQQIEKAATDEGLVELGWQARLAMAEIEIGSGKLSLAREHLASIEGEALPKGYRLLARKAADLNAHLRNPGRASAH